MPKLWYQSKTVWVNLITMAIMVLTLFTAAENSALLPTSIVPWIAIVIAVLNIVLRVWFTESAIVSKSELEKIQTQQKQ